MSFKHTLIWLLLLPMNNWGVNSANASIIFAMTSCTLSRTLRPTLTSPMKIYRLIQWLNSMVALKLPWRSLMSSLPPLMRAAFYGVVFAPLLLDARTPESPAYLTNFSATTGPSLPPRPVRPGIPLRKLPI